MRANLRFMVDIKSKLSIASEIRDGIDTFQSSNDYAHFLSKTIPEILKLLESVPVSFSSVSQEHVSKAFYYWFFIR